MVVARAILALPALAFVFEAQSKIKKLWVGIL